MVQLLIFEIVETCPEIQFVAVLAARWSVVNEHSAPVVGFVILRCLCVLCP